MMAAPTSSMMRGHAQRAMLCMNVYISEGRRDAVLCALKDAATSGKHVALVSNFVDRYYNRSSYTLAAYEENLPALCDAGVGIAKVALESIDMHAHKAKHPRLGTVDHISCHSMHTSRGDRAPADNAALASSVGRALGSQLKVPVMLYGSVTAIRTGGHETTVSLAELRRSQGYFERVPDRDVDDEWSGLPSKLLRDAGASGRIAFGPQEQIDGRVGVACVGSVPWVTNFNVQLDTDSMDIAKSIASRVSSRGGGHDSVETMALRYGDGIIEVACNLLDTDVTPPEVVEDHVTTLAHAQDVSIVRSYCINPTMPELAARAETMLLRKSNDS